MFFRFTVRDCTKITLRNNINSGLYRKLGFILVAAM